MRKILTVAALAIMAAGAAQAQNDARRQQVIDRTLPAGDRTGIEMVFPIEMGGFNSVFEIAYDPAQVSENTVRARIAKICKAHGIAGPLHVWRPSKAIKVKGETRVIHSTTLGCFSR